MPTSTVYFALNNNDSPLVAHDDDYDDDDVGEAFHYGLS